MSVEQNNNGPESMLDGQMSYMHSGGNGNTHRLLIAQVSGERSITVSQTRKVSYFKAIRESHSGVRQQASVNRGSLLEAL